MRWTIKSIFLCGLCGGICAQQVAAQDQNVDPDSLVDEDAASPSSAEPAAAASSPAPSTSTATAPLATISVGKDEPPPMMQQEPTANRVITEIIVTAQKREENLQDVPISVAAFSGDQLQALGVDNPRDLGSITPGFVTNESLGFALYNIRGVGSDIFVPSADAGIATYIDGIYQPLPIGLATDFGKLERIEVLKGPQGTLYGRNTVGGAVNIITKKPSDQMELYLRGEHGSFDTNKLKVYVSGPLFSDVLSAGISAIRNTSHTYYKPVARSVIQHFSDDVMQGVNPRVTLRLGDEFDATLSGMYVQTKGPSVQLGTLNPFPLYAPLMAEQGDYEVSRDTQEDQWQNDNRLGYIEINWRPAPFSVKLLASRELQRQKQPVGGLDYDQSELPLASANQRAFGKVDTAELQFSSTPGGWLSDGFVWTFGVYYYKADTGIDPIVLTAAPVSGEDLPLLSGLLDPLLGVLPLPDLGVSLASHGILATDSLAGYGQVTWDVTDWFGVTLGARYQTEDRGLTRADSNVLAPDGSEIRLANYPLESVTTRRFSPKISLQFHPFGDDMLLYISYQRATKSGTFNIINLTAAPTEVKPQDVTAYEAGIKGTFLDRKLRYDVATYRYEIKNFQAQYVSLTSGGALNLYNAPHAISRGVEANLVWQMFPHWAPGFALTAGAAFIDAKFDDFPNGSGYDNAGVFFGERALLGPLAPPRDFTGNDMTSSPKWTAVLGINQLLEMPGGTLEIGVNASYNSGFYFDVQNTERSAQPEYTQLGAHISYLYEPWGLRGTLSGQNLTDTLYYRSRLTSDFGTASQVAPPRAISFSLEWDFQ